MWVPVWCSAYYLVMVYSYHLQAIFNIAVLLLFECSKFKVQDSGPLHGQCQWRAQASRGAGAKWRYEGAIADRGGGGGMSQVPLG